MFTFTVKMSLQMFYSNIMAHMPSAYGLGKKTKFNKVQFSSVQYSINGQVQNLQKLKYIPLEAVIFCNTSKSNLFE